MTNFFLINNFFFYFIGAHLKHNFLLKFLNPLKKTNNLNLKNYKKIVLNKNIYKIYDLFLQNNYFFVNKSNKFNNFNLPYISSIFRINTNNFKKSNYFLFNTKLILFQLKLFNEVIFNITVNNKKIFCLTHPFLHNETSSLNFFFLILVPFLSRWICLIINLID